MFERVVPVNKDRHGGKKVRASNDFRFASKFHVAYVTVHEFARAAAIYPLVFLEDNDQFRSVALMGLDAGENLFIDSQGQWQNSHHDSWKGVADDEDGAENSEKLEESFK